MTLLRHTPKEISERSALTINPAKTCQPIGAMYAGLGVRGCLPHSHGSQGCCAYHRSTLTRHYKEPISAGTSSFTEGASVFGGQANLLQAIQNIFTIYEPDVIAVHTTCLSETIGDDLGQIADKAQQEGKIPEGKYVIHASTPSYVGSHVTGFSNMCVGIAKGFGKAGTQKTGKVNILPGFVEPSDMEELKRLATAMDVKHILFPDTSGVVNAPLMGEYHMFPDAGTPIEELLQIGGSKGTIALGEWASAQAARFMDTEFKVPCAVLDLPIGLRATDRFIDTLRKVAGKNVPAEIDRERGLVVDFLSDMHQYFYHKKVALWGDPDQLISLVEFLRDLDMLPVAIVTGTPGKKFEKRIAEIMEETNMPVPYKVKCPGDMFLMHQWIKNEPVDLLIGNTYGKFIARDENIPFVRHGFPILDRQGHQYFPTVGYKGALRLMEKILDVLLSKADAETPEEKLELVY
ncbi:nitrogenase molybdenum-iron protein beta chain [Desulfovibrio sp. X2]|uniref:nitrogenase molybdenum-iron protein subunit beta n=1 Tax=Desulfovibrio sp. X2 TaxID=941449 RepID=UPI0003587E16|nr:nitrogenase molybdenum-iron protein subunit beta [Desulfovibrio sp. X2]EPR42533.1 nitrogenase molybdenum-iron protein beta chain [Desulfovibrio sp. X2]